MRAWVKRYVELGFNVVPVAGKRPCFGFTSHGPYLTAGSAVPADATGLAVIVGSRYVLDVDKRNGGLETLLDLPTLPRTWTAQTAGGGFHYWFSSDGRERPAKPYTGVDLLTGFRYVVVAPSPGYVWSVPPTGPLAPLPSWVPVREAAPPAHERPDAELPYDVRLDRARSYCDAYPPAVSGQGGHIRTFILAQRLVHQFALSEGDALTELTRWNRTNLPPWSDKELRHKVSSARRHGTMKQGVRS